MPNLSFLVSSLSPSKFSPESPGRTRTGAEEVARHMQARCCCKPLLPNPTLYPDGLGSFMEKRGTPEWPIEPKQANESPKLLFPLPTWLPRDKVALWQSTAQEAGMQSICWLMFLPATSFSPLSTPVLNIGGTWVSSGGQEASLKWMPCCILVCI